MAQPTAAAVVPPVPRNEPDAAFKHVLEHVIRLDTQAKRDRTLVNVGV
jgi:hypothetical protein